MTALNPASTAVDQPAPMASEEAPPSMSAPDNPVRRAIEEFKELTFEMDELRDLLRAHGIPPRTTRLMVEFGLQSQPKQLAVAMDSAMEQAEKEHGDGALKRNVVENSISTIVNLERDLTHARSAAKEEGLDVTALFTLLKMIQQSPGDGGSKPVNTFLGYALAYGVSTDKLAEIAGEHTQRSGTVLPQIQRKTEKAAPDRKIKLIQDMVLGLIIGVIIISMLL